MLTRRQHKNFGCNKTFVQFAFNVLIHIVQVKKAAHLQGLALTPFFKNDIENTCGVPPFTFILYLSSSEDNVLVIKLCWPYFFRFLFPVNFSLHYTWFPQLVHTQLSSEILQAASSHHLWEEIYQRLVITQFLP